MRCSSLTKVFSVPAWRIGLLMAAVWLMQEPATGAVPPITAHQGNSSSTGASPEGASPLGKPPPAIQPKHANFLAESPSRAARQVADWAVSSGNNGGLPFVVIDKINAKLFVFDSTGQLRGASMVLLGLAHGDDTTPGIGNRKLAEIRPEERTTPAGRFVAALGHDLQRDILWVDYDAAISLHRVVTGNPGDHRRQRLASNSPLNKRISYGCINVPARFYDGVVLKVFTETGGIVYILPELRKLEDVFPLAALGPGEKR